VSRARLTIPAIEHLGSLRTSSPLKKGTVPLGSKVLSDVSPASERDSPLFQRAASRCAERAASLDFTSHGRFDQAGPSVACDQISMSARAHVGRTGSPSYVATTEPPSDKRLNTARNTCRTPSVRGGYVCGVILNKAARFEVLATIRCVQARNTAKPGTDKLRRWTADSGGVIFESRSSARRRNPGPIAVLVEQRAQETASGFSRTWEVSEQRWLHQRSERAKRKSVGWERA
jgi:hypothetical protein